MVWGVPAHDRTLGTFVRRGRRRGNSRTPSAGRAPLETNRRPLPKTDHRLEQSAPRFRVSCWPMERPTGRPPCRAPVWHYIAASSMPANSARGPRCDCAKASVAIFNGCLNSGPLSGCCRTFCKVGRQHGTLGRRANGIGLTAYGRNPQAIDADPHSKFPATVLGGRTQRQRLWTGPVDPGPRVSVPDTSSRLLCHESLDGNVGAACG